MAENDLKICCITTNNFLEEGGHHFLGFDPDDKMNIRNALGYTWEWLSMHPHAKKHEFEAQLEVLEEVVLPIMMRVQGLSAELPSDSD